MSVLWWLWWWTAGVSRLTVRLWAKGGCKGFSLGILYGADLSFLVFFSVLPQSEHHLPIKQDNNQTTNKGPANVSSPDCLSTAGQSLRWRETSWEWPPSSDSAGQGVCREGCTLVWKLKRWLLWSWRLRSTESQHILNMFTGGTKSGQQMEKQSCLLT